MQSHILVEFSKKVYQKRPLGKMKTDSPYLLLVALENQTISHTVSKRKLIL